jgi:hypothetical protein
MHRGSTSDSHGGVFIVALVYHGSKGTQTHPAVPISHFHDPFMSYYHTLLIDMSSFLSEPKSSASGYRAQHLSVESCQYRAAPEPSTVRLGHQ